MVEYNIKDEEYNKLVDELTQEGFNYSNFPKIEEDLPTPPANKEEEKQSSEKKNQEIKEPKKDEAKAHQQPIFYNKTSDVVENIFF